MGSNATDARWKQLEEFPNYWVSDDGRVFSMSQKRVRKTYIDQDGNPAVRLFKDKRSGYTRSVNKLVREAFDSKEKKDEQEADSLRRDEPRWKDRTRA